MSKYFLIFHLFIFFGCSSSDSLEEKGEVDSENVFIPEQSENCLLGEKIVAYKDSLNKENKLIQIPVWRKDNFQK